MKNNYIHHMPYLRNSIACDHDFWCTCVKWWYLQAFCSFFKILIFWGVSGVKGQKIVQNDKKICLSCSISQEPYIIWWLSFLVRKCKMIISPGVFFIFSKFCFFSLFGGSKAQNGKKLCHALYLRNHTSWSLFMVDV